MLSNFYWVIENEVGGMGMPTALRAWLYLEDADQAAREEMNHEINQLKELGVGAIVSLTEAPLPRAVFEEAGFRYLHIPVPDMTAPTPSQIENFVAFARQCVEEGRPVATHCLGGSGRTGTMISCYLVSKGMNAEQAIQTVRTYRPSAVETFWQEEAVQEYASLHSNP
ncbi:MAG: protein phosphatase [bacterium]|nr:protein phosphatase [bacterium]